MKIAVISDVHSNLGALEAVVKDIESQGVDHVYCLGDIIGYGPFPSECLAIVRKLTNDVIVMGNHEDGVLHLEAAKIVFNSGAFSGIKFSHRKLSAEELSFIGGLPMRLTFSDLELSLAHSSFDNPGNWNYLYNEWFVKMDLENVLTRIGVIGHTHLPFVCDKKNGFYMLSDIGLILERNRKYLINVGSVGQPRDRDCRASYGIFEYCDTEVIYTLRRVAYDIEASAKSFRKFHLSPSSSQRLFAGE